MVVDTVDTVVDMGGRVVLSTVKATVKATVVDVDGRATLCMVVEELLLMGESPFKPSCLGWC